MYSLMRHKQKLSYPNQEITRTQTRTLNLQKETLILPLDLYSLMPRRGVSVRLFLPAGILYSERV